MSFASMRNDIAKNSLTDHCDLNQIQKKAIIRIQKLCRGHLARKKIILTMPRVLTHLTKSQLWDAAALPTQEAMIDKIFAVHATNYFPTDGIIKVVEPQNITQGMFFRPTTHFALGGLVRSHANGNWENRKYTIITPLRDLIPQLLNINIYDTFILGDFRLTNDSIVLVPNSERDQQIKRYPKLHLVGYAIDKKNDLRKAINKVIKKKKGYEIETYVDADSMLTSAMVASTNFNVPKIFAPIFSKKRDVSFGYHNRSLFGSAYFLGTVDYGLNKIIGCNSSYEREPAFMRLVIEYALKKIECSFMNQDKERNLKILASHIKLARERLMQLPNGRIQCSINSDYQKACIVFNFSWPDLHELMQLQNLSIYNVSVFLCVYAFTRGIDIGEQASKQEGIISLFYYHLNQLSDKMREDVIDECKRIERNYTGKKYSSNFLLQKAEKDIAITLSSRMFKNSILLGVLGMFYLELLQDKDIGLTLIIGALFILLDSQYNVNKMIGNFFNNANLRHEKEFNKELRTESEDKPLIKKCEM